MVTGRVAEMVDPNISKGEGANNQLAPPRRKVCAATGAVDCHQTYFGGSVVVKASTVIGREISPTSALIFTAKGVMATSMYVTEIAKVRNLASFKTSSNMSGPCVKTHHDVRNLKQKCNALIFAVEGHLHFCPNQKISRENVVNRQ